MDEIQKITTPSGEEMIVLAREDYDRLVEAAREVEVAQEIAEIKRRIANGEEETISLELFEQLMLGDEPRLKVWRKYRGLTQAALAERAGIRQATISTIENGRSLGSARSLSALAGALSIPVELLMPSPDENGEDKASR